MYVCFAVFFMIKYGRKQRDARRAQSEADKQPGAGAELGCLNIHICQVNVYIYTPPPRAPTYADVFGSVLENMPGI